MSLLLHTGLLPALHGNHHGRVRPGSSLQHPIREQMTNTRRILFSATFFLCFAVSHAQEPYTLVAIDSKHDLWDVAFSDTLHGMAVGNFGIILTTSDGGASWSQQISKSQLAFRKVLSFTPKKAVAVGLWSTMFRTTDGGAVWTEIPFPDKRMFIGIARIDSVTAWISGEKGLLLKTTDAGEHWREFAKETEKMLDAISFADSLNGWCSSSQGILLHTTNGGGSWVEQKTDSPLPAGTLYARSQLECWIAGYAGLMARTTDGGTSWRNMTAYETNYTRIAFDSRGTGWAVGQRGAVVRADAKKGKWAVYSTIPVKSLNALAVLENKKLIAVGSEGTIVTLRTK
jgi:photosystem II stability/assembly factor-like uncharacterized protein